MLDIHRAQAAMPYPHIADGVLNGNSLDRVAVSDAADINRICRVRHRHHVERRIVTGYIDETVLEGDVVYQLVNGSRRASDTGISDVRSSKPVVAGTDVEQTVFLDHAIGQRLAHGTMPTICGDRGSLHLRMPTPEPRPKEDNAVGVEVVAGLHEEAGAERPPADASDAN